MKKEKKIIRRILNIRLPETLYKLLDDECKKREVTKTQVICELLKNLKD